MSRLPGLTHLTIFLSWIFLRSSREGDLQSSIRRFVFTEKAPTRAFSWLKAATIAFTFKTLLRHYAKRALTPRSLNVKLGPRRNYHEGRAAIRHCANQHACPLWPLRRGPNFRLRAPSRGLLRDCTTGCGTYGSICGTTPEWSVPSVGMAAVTLVRPWLTVLAPARESYNMQMSSVSTVQ